MYFYYILFIGTLIINVAQWKRFVFGLIQTWRANYIVCYIFLICARKEISLDIFVSMQRWCDEIKLQ